MVLALVYRTYFYSYFLRFRYFNIFLENVLPNIVKCQKAIGEFETHLCTGTKNKLSEYLFHIYVFRKADLQDQDW